VLLVRRGTMAEERFRLPGSSYQELVKIIRAYGQVPENASPKDVADRAVVNETVVSRNNAFLVGVSVLAGGRKKSMTTAGKALSQALEFDMPDQIAAAWRAIAAENEFLRKVVSAVRIRGGMDITALRNHVAYTAGERRTPKTLTGAGAVIDVLLAANLLVDQDGKIVASDLSDSLPGATPELERSMTGKLVDKREQRREPQPGQSQVSISININLNCGPEDIDDLAPRVKRLVSDLQEDLKPDEEA
jgi:hypothetical protein